MSKPDETSLEVSELPADHVLEVAARDMFEQAVTDDHFDQKYAATRWEIWAYYLYYAGNSSISGVYAIPAAQQYLMSQAANADGKLFFGGRLHSVNSLVLLGNGIAFAIQVVLLLMFGSFADFGSWRPWILILWTVVSVVIGCVPPALTRPDQWISAFWLAVWGIVAYNIAYTFYLATFPGLARQTPTIRAKMQEYLAGRISREEYDRYDSLKRNELSNLALYMNGVGTVFISLVGAGILYSIKADDSISNSIWGYSLFSVWASVAFLLLALPWFFLEKWRPSQPIPAGKNIMTAGFWQLRRAAREIRKLKQTLSYFVVFFALSDSLASANGLEIILQNAGTNYSAKTLAWLTAVQFASGAAGVYTLWRIQRHWKISTKTMLIMPSLGTVFLSLWGMIGNWTTTIGWSNVWEYWFYNFAYGFFACPYFSYAQTMISEVVPRGKEFLFFSFFNMCGKTAFFVGPLVTSAIIDASGSTHTAFYYSFAVGVVSTVWLIFGVDLAASQREQARYLKDELLERGRMSTEAS